MTLDELLAICDNYSFKNSAEPVKALRAVVEIVEAFEGIGVIANEEFDQGVRSVCRVIIQAIEKELK